MEAEQGSPTLGEGRSTDAVLDNPVWESLSGAHRRLGQWRGRAAAYLPDVCSFSGLPRDADGRDWADLAALTDETHLFAVPDHRPAACDLTPLFTCLQMVDTRVGQGGDSPDAVVLGPEDAAEVLSLAQRTEPGPFSPRTMDMGTYVGVRLHGRLVAMAGQRLAPGGWVEISAVCTDPAARGRGLARRLVLEVVADARRRGCRAFLHVRSDNTAATALYASLGFTVRSELTIHRLRAP